MNIKIEQIFINNDNNIYGMAITNSLEKMHNICALAFDFLF